MYDVAVIGGGVVGCAILRRFAIAGAKCILLEKGADILSGASKGNSAILHTGFDAPTGSLELACMQSGYAEYVAIRERLNLPLLETGALLVAWTEAERAQLPEIIAKAHANGVPDVVSIDASEVYRREPGLAPGALGAVRVPHEHVIDPWSAPLAYALQALAHGAQIHRNTEVVGGDLHGDAWSLRTSQGELRARTVINAAGLYGDIVEAINRPSPFDIKPRKGQFVVFDKTAAKLVQSIILPVPDKRTKGVLLCRTAFGNLLVGPTAEDQNDRDAATVDNTTLKMLVGKAAQLVPALADEPVTAVYAGLRPATQFQDYQIEVLPDRCWITVAGIRSTGLTAALGIAQYVVNLYLESIGELADVAITNWPKPANICEYSPRPYREASSEHEIICHCERVTRAEILAALNGALPAGDIGGLKRRTRCMMGRCQGFYCSARIAELAAPKLPHMAAPIIQ